MLALEHCCSCSSRDCFQKWFVSIANIILPQSFKFEIFIKGSIRFQTCRAWSVCFFPVCLSKSKSTFLVDPSPILNSVFLDLQVSFHPWKFVSIFLIFGGSPHRKRNVLVHGSKFWCFEQSINWFFENGSSRHPNNFLHNYCLKSFDQGLQPLQNVGTCWIWFSHQTRGSLKAPKSAIKVVSSPYLHNWSPVASQLQPADFFYQNFNWKLNHFWIKIRLNLRHFLYSCAKIPLSENFEVS